MFGCRSALLQSRRAEGTDAECQVEEDESERTLSSLTKQQLELEVQTLSQERDHLIQQLEESTEAFQLQLKSLEDKCEPDQHLFSFYSHCTEGFGLAR